MVVTTTPLALTALTALTALIAQSKVVLWASGTTTSTKKLVPAGIHTQKATYTKLSCVIFKCVDIIPQCQRCSDGPLSGQALLC